VSVREGTQLSPQLRDAEPVLRLVEVHVELVRGLDGRPARRGVGLAPKGVARRWLLPPVHGQACGEVPQTYHSGAGAEEVDPALAD